MQFDDGSTDVAPGENIVVEGSNGGMDLGAASYDSDHDGVADSVVIGEGELTMVATDSDHDGTADSVKAYNADGEQVDPKTGQPIDPSAHPDGPEGTVDPVSGPGSEPGQDPGEPTDPQPSHGQDGGISVTGADGAPVSVGNPTVDMDKDGRPDTAVVKEANGQVTGYTDRDGDGTADQITQVSADGNVVIAVDDDNGGWKVVATGHLDSSGNLVQDPSPRPGAEIHAPNTADQPTQPGNQTADPGTTPADPGQPEEPAEPAQQGHSAGEITITRDGEEYELGKPTADMDGDGKPDTVVSKQSDGTVIGYTDSDGNGTADRITQISPNGAVIIAEPDGNGGWTQVGSGHLDSDGNFVPDTQQGAVRG